MGFQSTIALNQGYGVPGEIVFEGPTRAAPGIVKGTAANIVVGRFFTIDPADGQYQPGGTAALGGILSNPKALQSIGTTAGGPLAPTLTVPAGTVCEFATMGEIVVQMTNACAVGDSVYYVQADGTLGAGTAGAGQTQIPNARVERFANAAAGLAVVSLTGLK